MRWITDGGDEIGLTFFNLVTFTKYKDQVRWHWFKKFGNAPKYYGK